MQRASLVHKRSTTPERSNEVVHRAPPRAALARGPAWDFSRVSVAPPSPAADRAKSSETAPALGEDVSQSDGPSPAEPMTPPTPAPAPPFWPDPKPPPAPAKKAKLKSGPTYTPSGTITATKSGGTKTATFNLSAEFENDSAHGIDPSVGEVRQFIKWTKDDEIPNHAGFRPKTDYSANTWYEDRDSVGKRYGHRSGTYSECVTINHYEDTAGTQNCATGEVFAGRDDPMDGSGAKTGKWLFELRAVDTANGSASVGTAASVTVDWNV